MGYHLYPLVLPPTIGCRSLHRRVSQTCLEMMIRHRCHLLGGQRCRIRIQRWWLCLPGPPKGSGSSGNLHRVPNPLGWTIGFSGWLALVLRAPPRYLSSRKCMMSSLDRGRHLSLPETVPVARPPTTLDGGAARGYMEIPLVERSVAMQLCPNTAATWRGNPLLPSRACRYSSALTGSAYAACGEAASALHAMALLQVHQAKALRDLHEGGHDPEVLKELRTATDLALRATKVTARSLGRAMSTMVVQERHLWLCLADMRESDKMRFLNAPVSQTGLFGDAVENFAQQFSAAQKQTEAIRHILPRRAAAASTRPPVAAPQSTRRRGRPPAAAPLPRSNRSSLQQSSAVEPVAGQPPRPSRPPPNLVASVRARGPETGDPEMEEDALREMVNAPLPPPEEGRVENLLFLFSPPLASRSVVPKNSTKEQFPLSLGPQRGWGVVDEPVLSHTHPPLSPVSSCGRFESAINRTTHAPSARTQVSVAHTLTLFRTGIETPEQVPAFPLAAPPRVRRWFRWCHLYSFWEPG